MGALDKDEKNTGIFGRPLPDRDSYIRPTMESVNPLTGIGAAAKSVAGAVGTGIEAIANTGETLYNVADNSIEDISAGYTGEESKSDWSLDGLVPDWDDTVRGDGVVPPVTGQEDDSTDTGLDDGTKFDIVTGDATDANGKDIGDPPTNLSIFDKASSLFGDILSASELKRMTLYTIGGLMTGGSFGGSFKWAGTQVLNEQQATLKNNATLASAAGKMKPVQLKVSNKDTPVNGYWSAAKGGYVDAVTQELLPNAEKYQERHSPTSLASHYKDIASGIIAKEGKDGPVLLGDTANNSYNKFRIKVEQWQREGADISLSDATTIAAYESAVTSAIAANRSGDVQVTPESFFDNLLIKGQMSNTAWGAGAFKDSDGNDIDVAANNTLMTGLGAALSYYKSKNPKVTSSAVNAGIINKWKSMGPDARAKFDNKSRDGSSGFVTYVDELLKQTKQ